MWEATTDPRMANGPWSTGLQGPFPDPGYPRLDY